MPPPRPVLSITQEGCPVLFHLQKFPYTHFSAINGPLGATRSHQLVTCHRQVVRPILCQFLKMLQL